MAIDPAVARKVKKAEAELAVSRATAAAALAGTIAILRELVSAGALDRKAVMRIEAETLAPLRGISSTAISRAETAIKRITPPPV